MLSVKDVREVKDMALRGKVPISRGRKKHAGKPEFGLLRRPSPNPKSHRLEFRVLLLLLPLLLVLVLSWMALATLLPGLQMAVLLDLASLQVRLLIQQWLLAHPISQSTRDLIL